MTGARVFIASAAVLSACSSSRSLGEFGHDSTVGASAGAETVSDETTQAADDSGSGSAGEARLDVSAGGSATAGDDQDGCTKIDFLFVVDNSSSMGTKQERLAANFPRFIDAIERQAGTTDFHIMVVDTDAEGYTACNPQCVQYWEDNEANVGSECPYEGQPCGATPEELMHWGECDETAGAGVRHPLGNDSSARDCGIAGGKRFMTADQPDLAGTFACAAQVGSGGSNTEQQIAALHAALSSELNGAGRCNEGFLRDDAILVVTLLTDEDQWKKDIPDLPEPSQWVEAVVEAKGGDPEAVVMLGLLNDAEPVLYGTGNGVCPTVNTTNYNDRLLEFIEAFPHGAADSICHEDFQPFFESSVALVLESCQTFIPG